MLLNSSNHIKHAFNIEYGTVNYFIETRGLGLRLGYRDSDSGLMDSDSDRKDLDSDGVDSTPSLPRSMIT